LRLTREGTTWRVAGTHAGQKINVTLNTTGAQPGPIIAFD
jgi:hypothetical protein